MFQHKTTCIDGIIKPSLAKLYSPPNPQEMMHTIYYILPSLLKTAKAKTRTRPKPGPTCQGQTVVIRKGKWKMESVSCTESRTLINSDWQTNIFNFIKKIQLNDDGVIMTMSWSKNYLKSCNTLMKIKQKPYECFTLKNASHLREKNQR